MEEGIRKERKEFGEFNILVFGEGETGKTTLVKKLASLSSRKKEFDPTFGVDLRAFKLKENFGSNIVLWDFGSDLFSQFCLEIYPKMLGNKIMALVYCFDLSNLKTLYNFEKWIYLLFRDNSLVFDIPVLLIGNKSDKNKDNYTAKALSEKYFLKFFANTNLENLFFISAFEEERDSGNFRGIKSFISHITMSKFKSEHSLIEDNERVDDFQSFKLLRHLDIKKFEIKTQSTIFSKIATYFRLLLQSFFEKTKKSIV